ncbi:hypothetical protein E2C01_000797 [Portunus trituberculatus]|uniref:Endonuclease/exonuclease/phosphatase domain-containing protein n=1 Tax=Portunus trituberculatus TaxID=210409 RepID=A0A5B7CF97_PORTR|nr:hypothetical protein [Portunus trituberculatus]
MHLQCCGVAGAVLSAGSEVTNQLPIVLLTQEKPSDGLWSGRETLIRTEGTPEISILSDFNVHHQLWLSTPFTDHPGQLAFNFAIRHALEQLVQHIRITDCLGDKPNILDFFLSSNSAYAVIFSIGLL